MSSGARPTARLRTLKLLSENPEQYRGRGGRGHSPPAGSGGRGADRPDTRRVREDGHHRRDQCAARAPRRAHAAGDDPRLSRCAAHCDSGPTAAVRPAHRAARTALRAGDRSRRARRCARRTRRAAGLGRRSRRRLQAAYEAGIRACAIVFMHAYRAPAHELAAEALARASGFTQVSVSHRVSPLMKLVPRGDTTVVDAYLSPILRRYVDRLAEQMPGVRLLFMQSSGGLTEAHRFQGKDAILSGPAGGIVGMVRSARAAGYERLIGFDMGGTSTDVSHFAGEYERAFETEVAGVRVRAPMMSIHTIAAGGGSVIRFDGARLRVGPESAGADPGPASYRRGGPLTITDANRDARPHSAANSFPESSARAADQPLDRDVVVQRFADLAARMSRGAGREVGPEEAAGGASANRRRQHGQCREAHLRGARLRCHALHAAMFRRRRRAACLPGRGRAGHAARVLSPLGGGPLRLRHGHGRPDRDARSGARAIARRSRARARRASSPRAWSRRRRAELAIQGVDARRRAQRRRVSMFATRAPTRRCRASCRRIARRRRRVWPRHSRAVRARVSPALRVSDAASAIW